MMDNFPSIALLEKRKEKKMQTQIMLILHKIEDTLINQRAIDGYVNATAMCKAVGKQFNDYTRLGPTKAFLAELAIETGIPVSQLI